MYIPPNTPYTNISPFDLTSEMFAQWAFQIFTCPDETYKDYNTRAYKDSYVRYKEIKPRILKECGYRLNEGYTVNPVMVPLIKDKKKMFEFRCKQCGKDFKSKKSAPTCCTVCKSPLWRKARVKKQRL